MLELFFQCLILSLTWIYVYDLGEMQPAGWFYSSLIAGSGELKLVWRAINVRAGTYEEQSSQTLEEQSNLLSLLADPACLWDILRHEKGKWTKSSLLFFVCHVLSTSSVVITITDSNCIPIITILSKYDDHHHHLTQCLAKSWLYDGHAPSLVMRG